MNSGLLKKRKKSNDSETERLIGDKYFVDAQKEFGGGNYRQASRDYKLARSSYGRALEEEGLGLDEKSRLEKSYRDATKNMEKTHRLAALYRATEKTPAVFKGLMRKLKARHIMIIYLVSLIFIAPQVTGNFAGVKDFDYSKIGLILFFSGIFLSYILIKKNILINKFLKS